MLKRVVVLATAENRGRRESQLTEDEIEKRDDLRINSPVVFEIDGELIKGHVKIIGVTTCKIRVEANNKIETYGVRYSQIKSWASW